MKNTLNINSNITPVVVIETQSKSPTSTNKTKNVITQNVSNTTFTANKNISVTTSDDLLTTNKQISAYEKQTGISQLQPEVVMMTNFSPLYKEKVNDSTITKNYTPTGDLFDLRINMQNLHNADIVSMMNEIVVNSTTTIPKRLEEFDKAFANLDAMSSYLWKVIMMLNQFKRQLDLKDPIHTVEPTKVLKQFLATYASSNNASNDYTTSFTNSFFLQSFTYADLLEMLGHSKNNVLNNYSSTKIWLQTLLEIKNILRSHSLSFLGLESSLLKKDNNSTKIIKTQNEVKRFGYNPNFPVVSQTYTLNDIYGISLSNVETVSNALSLTYKYLYDKFEFKSSDDKISALVNLITKEFRYSYGLSKSEVQQSLQTYYQYHVEQNGNQTMFDTIIGQFGNNIADIALTNPNSLSAIAQIKPGENIAVLPFETTYIEGSAGTLTPGNVFYVDSVLINDGTKYNTEQLTNLKTIFDKATKNFAIIAAGMNLFASEYVDSSSTTSNSLIETYSNPHEFFDSITKNFVVIKNNTTEFKFKDDPITPLFEYALTNTSLKSLLALYCILKSSYTTTSIDVAAIKNKIIDLIINEVKNISSNQSSVIAKRYNQTVTNIITEKMIRSALQNDNSLLLTTVIMTLKEYVSTYKRYAINSTASRYSNVIDTHSFLSMFDLISNVVSKLSGQKIVGQNIDRSQSTFNIKTVSVDCKQVISSVKQKVDKEIVLIQQSLFAIFNSLRKLSNSAANILTYLEDKKSIETLQELSNIVNDSDSLHMLFSESQIRLVTSHIADVSTTYQNIKKQANEEKSLFVIDINKVSTKLRDIIANVFSNPKFINTTSKKILTVGIPQGFISHLKQRVDVGKFADTNRKQEDVINVVVYKTDKLNPDIIFKPLKFLFECSKFPVKAESDIRQVNGSGIDDILSKIGIRDSLETSNDNSSSFVQYINATNQQVEVFASSEYSFLTKQQKQEICSNHIMSYLLETYIRTLTGMSTSEFDIDIVDQPYQMEQNFIDLIKFKEPSTIMFSATTTVTTTSTSTTKTKTTNMFTTTARATYGGTLEAIDLDTRKAVEVFSKSSDMDTANINGRTPNSYKRQRTIDDMSKTLTNVGDPILIMQKFLSPKQFDRVFNIIVDPFEFEIDVEKTLLSQQGSRAYQDLLSAKEIDIVNDVQRIKKNPIDENLVFDRYIVAIETIDSNENSEGVN